MKSDFTTLPWVRRVGWLDIGAHEIGFQLYCTLRVLLFAKRFLINPLARNRRFPYNDSFGLFRNSMAASRKKAAGRRPPLVGVVMGSRSDWETLAVAEGIFDELGIPHEVKVVSAHRTPKLLYEYASNAEKRGLHVIIAAAGGAAHLPGMIASMTALPVLGVPVLSSALHGLDSLLSIVQMPAGVPVGTLAIGKPGAANAALLAAAILGTKFPEYRSRLAAYREKQTRAVAAKPDPRVK
jgi:5-(carboxyamino)imidazole ribonucleotide mutase